jgi:hypothetical protein
MKAISSDKGKLENKDWCCVEVILIFAYRVWFDMSLALFIIRNIDEIFNFI